MSNKSKAKSDYIHKPTGEIISGKDLQRIPTDKEQEARDKYKEKQEKILQKLDGENFIKQYFGSYYHFIYGSLCDYSKEDKRMELNHGARLLRLACEMEYDTGRLVDLDSKPYKSLTEEQIINLLKISERDWQRTRKYLVDKGLLKYEGKGKNKEFYLNTEICLKGELPAKAINTKVLGISRVFNHSYSYMYDNLEKKERNTLFYLARLLPFVNVEYNIVCGNPLEENIKEIVPLSVGEICKIIDIEPQHFSRLMNKLMKLKVQGKYALCKIVTGEKSRYIMNPALFYQGNNRDSLKLIEGLMEESEKKKTDLSSMSRLNMKI